MLSRPSMALVPKRPRRGARWVRKNRHGGGETLVSLSFTFYFFNVFRLNIFGRLLFLHETTLTILCYGYFHVLGFRSQVVLSKLVTAVGLAFIYHSTSNSLISLFFCIGVLFRRTLYHWYWTMYMYWYACRHRLRFLRRQTVEEYDQNGIDETAQALYE